MGATVEEGTWVVTSYLVSNAIILPMAGWLAVALWTPPHADGVRHRLHPDLAAVRHGHQPGVADLLPRTARAQRRRSAAAVAVGAAGDVSSARRHGTAMAAFGLGIIFAPILGPTLGGWITDNYTWRWIFYINLPVGILSLLMISQFVVDPHYLRKRNTRRRRPVGHRAFSRSALACCRWCSTPASAKTGSAATRFACGRRCAWSAWSAW